MDFTKCDCSRIRIRTRNKGAFFADCGLQLPTTSSTLILEKVHLAAANSGRIFARKGDISLQARTVSTQFSPLSHGHALGGFFSTLTFSLEVGSGAASYLELPWEWGLLGLSQLQRLAEWCDQKWGWS